MLVRYSDWTRPTDDAYAFVLRPLPAHGTALLSHAPGHTHDIRQVIEKVLGAQAAERFETRVRRWSGPEDVDASGAQPYLGQQLHFEECAWSPGLGMSDIERVLRGAVRVMRRDGQTDYVLRDHHMVDVVLYHYATTGALPGTLFHADRHSDWCQDSYLQSRAPDQAATWWALLEGLKRPAPQTQPVLRERDVFFTTAQAQRSDRTQGRDIGASTLVPGCVDPAGTGWQQVLEAPGALDCDWVSLDLDYFQPVSQLRLTGPLLRDERFLALLRRAPVRVFVLSPQFNHGGDRLERWEIHGSVSSSLRLLNWLRTSGTHATSPLKSRE